MHMMLQIEHRLASVLLVALIAGACGETRKCACSFNCTDDVVYCAEQADGLVCHDNPDAFWWWQEPSGRGEADSLTPGGVEDSSDSPEAGGTTVDLQQQNEVQGLPDTIKPDGAAPAPEGELRGLWVTRWDYDSAQAVEGIVENVAAFGFNAIFFQVRGGGDAFYNSSVEPWAKDLTGTLGKDPGWDPLQVAVDAAHAHGLELHAWMNTFTAWSGTSEPPQCEPPHMLSAHPDWRVVDEDGLTMEYNNSYTWVSPGIPGVREHVKSVALEIVQNYDVDGLHFDYIRYPGPQYSHDPWTMEAFEEAKAEDASLIWGDFQRRNISDFVAEAYEELTTADPAVKVTAAVWGIYKDDFGWGGTSQGYHDYYQDSHGWLAAGAVDAICPMVYWPLTEPKGGWTDFATLADHHLAASAGRHVYVGLKSDQEYDEVIAEVEYLRSAMAPGYAVFAYSTLHQKAYGPLVAEDLHSEPASPPAMPWKQQGN